MSPHPYDAKPQKLAIEQGKIISIVRLLDVTHLDELKDFLNESDQAMDPRSAVHVAVASILLDARTEIRAILAQARTLGGPDVL